MRGSAALFVVTTFLLPVVGCEDDPTVNLVQFPDLREPDMAPPRDVGAMDDGAAQDGGATADRKILTLGDATMGGDIVPGSDGGAADATDLGSCPSPSCDELTTSALGEVVLLETFDGVGVQAEGVGRFYSDGHLGRAAGPVLIEANCELHLASCINCPAAGTQVVAGDITAGPLILLQTGNDYTLPVGAIDLWESGASFTVSGSGSGNVGPFESVLTAPTDFGPVVIEPESSISRGGSTVAWFALGEGLTRVELHRVGDDETVVCHANDAVAREISIPPEAVAWLSPGAEEISVTLIRSTSVVKTSDVPPTRISIVLERREITRAVTLIP